MKTFWLKYFFVLGWLVAFVLSVCLWQEYHSNLLFENTVIRRDVPYPVYINRDTPETTKKLKNCQEMLSDQKDLTKESQLEVDLLREKLKKMELP